MRGRRQNQQLRGHGAGAGDDEGSGAGAAASKAPTNLTVATTQAKDGSAVAQCDFGRDTRTSAVAKSGLGGNPAWLLAQAVCPSVVRVEWGSGDVKAWAFFVGERQALTVATAVVEAPLEPRLLVGMRAAYDVQLDATLGTYIPSRNVASVTTAGIIEERRRLTTSTTRLAEGDTVFCVYGDDTVVRGYVTDQQDVAWETNGSVVAMAGAPVITIQRDHAVVCGVCTGGMVDMRHQDTVSVPAMVVWMYEWDELKTEVHPEDCLTDLMFITAKTCVPRRGNKSGKPKQKKKRRTARRRQQRRRRAAAAAAEAAAAEAAAAAAEAAAAEAAAAAAEGGGSSSGGGSGGWGVAAPLGGALTLAQNAGHLTGRVIRR